MFRIGATELRHLAKAEVAEILCHAGPDTGNPLQIRDRWCPPRLPNNFATLLRVQLGPPRTARSLPGNGCQPQSLVKRRNLLHASVRP
jgi:hypothetical protein